MNRHVLGILAVVPLLLASADKAGSDPRDAGPDSIDVSGWPQEQQQRYPLFQQKCSRCHPIARAVNARFNATDWKRYAKKMIRRPNAGVNDTQAGELYQFLAYYARHTGMEK